MEPPKKSSVKLLNREAVAEYLKNCDISHSISQIGQKPYLQSDLKVQIQNEENPFKVFEDSPVKTEEEQRLDYLLHLERQSHLSVTALQKFINYNHPKKLDQETGDHRNWSICEEIGTMVQLNCFADRKILKVSKNVGLGASLFMLSLKAYIKLFFVMSVLAIPSMVVLSSGT